MKLYFDFEFAGLYQDTTPISLGVVSNDNKMFYAEFDDYDHSRIDQWITTNVLKNLVTESTILDIPVIRGNREYIKNELTKWLSQFDSIEMWGDCMAYDWVLFCQLFGGAMFIPQQIHYIPHDLCTLLLAKGLNPDIGRRTFCNFQHDYLPQHNSLVDSLVIKECVNKLLNG